MKNNVNKEYTTEVGTHSEFKEPSLYQILLHKDDFTPMEFVVNVLERFFYMARPRATEVMLDAHTQGKAVCGVFSKDFAEAKVSQIIEYAESHEYPLNCSMEST